MPVVELTDARWWPPSTSDDSPRHYRRHDVLALRTVVLFVDGRPRRRLVGARGRQQLLEEIGDDLR